MRQTPSRAICIAFVATLPLVGCFTVPAVGSGDAGGGDTGAGADSSIDGGDRDTAGADLAADMSRPDMVVTPVQEFRTTRGLVAAYSMRNPSTTEIIDDIDPAQNLVLTNPGAGEVGRVRTDGSATGPITEASRRINASGSWTIEVWVELIGSLYGDLVTTGSLRLETNYLSGVNSLAFSDGATEVRSRAAVARGLHHIVATSDGVRTRLYVNGYLAGAALIDFDDTFGDTLTVGGDNFDGAFEYIALYDRALSHGEIAFHLLVGPDPAPSDEKDEVVETVFAWQSRFEARTAIDAFEVGITDDSDGRTNIALSSTQRILTHLALPQALPGEVSKASLRHLAGSLTDGSSVELWAMSVPWTTDATWTMRTLDDAWEEPGASGPTDRQTVPVGTAVIDYQGQSMSRTMLSFDITDIAAAQLAAGQTFGWMLTSDSTQSAPASYSVEVDDDVAGRPSLLFLGQAGSPPALPEALSQPQATVVDGSSVQLTWQGSAPLYEVYLDGLLWARSSKTSVVFGNPTNLSVFQVAAADDFGQTSDPETFPNPLP